MKVEVQYNASATGGSRLYLNGLTQPTWGVTGNYARTANLAVVQLWNDAVGTTDFDDARISTKPPQGATLPGAPSGVTGSPRDRGAALSWTAPASNGGSAISGYRITPYIGVAGPDADDHRLSGHELHGHGSDERDDVHVPRRGDQRRRNRRRLGGFRCDHAGCGDGAGRTDRASPPCPTTRIVTVGWTPPANDGGAPLTGYRITPLHRLERTDAGHRQRRDDDELRRDRSDERDDVHLPRRGDQRRRDRPGLGCIAGGDAEAGTRAIHEPRLLPTASRPATSRTGRAGRRARAPPRFRRSLRTPARTARRIATLETQYAYFSSGACLAASRTA